LGDAARWPLYGKEEEMAVQEIVKTTSFESVARLEKDWREHFNVPYTRAFCNGTSAITTMYFAMGLPPGSEVLVPSYTFFAAITPMRFFGLVPVFVDVNPRTLNFDLEDAKRRLTKNTKAIMVVHWNGLPCEMDHICDFAKDKGLIVLEDACHADGASIKGKNIGSWGEMAAFSFNYGKPLPAMEGGLAVYHKSKYYERGSTLANTDNQNSFPENSEYRKYNGSGLGLKLRIQPMSSALACIQLRKLDENNANKVAATRRLNDKLIRLPGLYEQSGRSDMKRTYYYGNILFINETEAGGMSREACVKALKAEGVQVRSHSYTLQHKLPLYSEAKWWHHAPVIPELPGSEQANLTTILLPRLTKDVPELTEQYVKAFEKVWANRKLLAIKS
ncbi:MAG: aminotransferase class I/II-fold pyridoxal phosphate-dependent enzyme, partial [Bacteroidales bacterium]|nr:aminotransferase class I/II-fold pyridoxal phosphate-dependent enzyme [Bacteroidales bacterium]